MAFERNKPRQDNVSKFNQKDGVEVFTGRLRTRPNPTGTPDPTLSRPIVGAASPYAVSTAISNPTGYADIAIMSLDGLLRPVSVTGGGDLSPFTKYSFIPWNPNAFNKSHVAQNRPKASMFPVYSGPTGRAFSNNLELTQRYLNPFINPLGMGLISGTGRHAQGSGGHDIELLAQRDSLAKGQSLVTVVGSGSGENYQPTYSDDYRFLCLRGPLILQGWGYDTDGKPIPNEADIYERAISGRFMSTGLRDRFMPDFMQKSKAWPVGPIDLRWDRNRGCWVAPTETYIARGMTRQNITPGQTGRVVLLNWDDYNSYWNLPTTTNGTIESLWDSTGGAIPINHSSSNTTGFRAEVICQNISLTNCAFSGTYVNIYYDTRVNRHVIWPLDETSVSFYKCWGAGTGEFISSATNMISNYIPPSRWSNGISNASQYYNPCDTSLDYISKMVLLSGATFIGRSEQKTSNFPPGRATKVQVIAAQQPADLIRYYIQSGTPVMIGSNNNYYAEATTVFDNINESFINENTKVAIRISNFTSFTTDGLNIIGGSVTDGSIVQRDQVGWAYLDKGSSMDGVGFPTSAITSGIAMLKGTGYLIYQPIHTNIDWRYYDCSGNLQDEGRNITYQMKVNSPLTLGVSAGNNLDFGEYSLGLDINIKSNNDIGTTSLGKLGVGGFIFNKRFNVDTNGGSGFCLGYSLDLEEVGQGGTITYVRNVAMDSSGHVTNVVFGTVTYDKYGRITTTG